MLLYGRQQLTINFNSYMLSRRLKSGNYNYGEEVKNTDYLRFTALQDGTFTLSIYSSLNTEKLNYIEYSIDEGETWTRTNNIDNQTVTITTPTVTTGNSVLWRGLGKTLAVGIYNGQNVSRFSSTGQCNVSGNICTLLNYNDPYDVSSFAIYTFCGLFNNMSYLIDASGLIIQSEDLQSYAYTSLFNSCTNLITAPTVLPARSLSYSCYSSMFSGCRSLVNPPILNAISLASHCCDSMFRDCTSLITAPELPSTDSAGGCYYMMFYDCTSLTTAPSILPAMVLTRDCYYLMFNGCTSLTKAPQLPAITLAQECYYHMFQDCTSLTTAPELPAAKLASSCYSYMFAGCTSLINVQSELNSFDNSYSSSYACSYMFKGCTSLTTAPGLTNILTEMGQSEMFSGCNSLNYIKFLYKYKPQYVSNWVTNVASSGTFVAHPLASWTQYLIGNSGVPNGWTVQYDNSLVTSFDPQYEFTPKGYLTLNIQSKLYLGLSTKVPGYSIYVSKNKTNWQLLQENDCLEFNSGEQCYLCGYLSGAEITPASYSNPGLLINGTFSMSGNCNSMWNYNNLNAPLRDACGYRLFKSCTGLISLEGFTLPSETLSIRCYYGMFEDCIALRNAPNLPATTAAQYCYLGMFKNCTSLEVAPEISITTTANYCCQDMFNGCTSLVTAPPELSATTLEDYCYYGMFSNCTSLTTFPELPTIENCKQYSLKSMFSGCISLTNAPTLSIDYAGGTECCRQMFQGCTSLTSIPDITITDGSNVYHSFYGIFKGCTSLVTPPFISIAFNKIYSGWFQSAFEGCTSLTSADCFDYSNIEYLDGSCFQETFKGCTSLVTVPTAIGNENCTFGGMHSLDAMFSGCTSLTTAPQLPMLTRVNSYTYARLFYGCTSLVKAPDLPPMSNVISNGCEEMFYGCSSLNYIKALFLSLNSQLSNWVVNVAATGIFVKHINSTWTITGKNGVPSGWTVIYFDPDDNKYYIDQQKSQECDDHGNLI